MEEYKIIERFENYGVSKDGNVKNLKTGKTIKKVVNKRGYEVVGLCMNKVKATFLVHRLVAKAFIDNPEDKPQVNHMDGNKSNNHRDNLEWCSHKENINHAFKSNLIKTKKPVKLINEFGEISCFDSTSSASKFIGVNNGTLNAILSGKRKTIKGYKAYYI